MVHFKKIFRTIVLNIFYWLDIIFPKKQNYILFSSFPDFSDNAFALCKYILENKYDNYQLIWYIDDMRNTNYYTSILHENNHILKEKIQKIIFIKKNSFRGKYYYLRSKYIFYTHGLMIGMPIPKNHIVVNLWHGMPLKNIGMLDYHKITHKSRYTIATSKLYQKIMTKAFNINLNRVLISGQPRNDLLFENTNVLEKFGISKNKYKNILVWMPTYRKAEIGDIREDGVSKKILPLFSINDLKNFDRFLNDKNSFLFIKLHPLDIVKKEHFSTFQNIKIIDNSDFVTHKCQLYHFMGEVDVLLTDFSSIYIDFLLTQKPIAFLFEDFSEYKNSRGFVFETPMEYMPGEKITDYKLLKVFLNNLIIHNIDNYRDERKSVNNTFNSIKRNFSKNLLTQLNIKRSDS